MDQTNATPPDRPDPPAPPTTDAAPPTTRADDAFDDVEGALEELIDERGVTLKLWSDGTNHHVSCISPLVEGGKTVSGDTRAAALHAALQWARDNVPLPPDDR